MKLRTSALAIMTFAAFTLTSLGVIAAQPAAAAGPLTPANIPETGLVPPARPKPGPAFLPKSTACPAAGNCVSVGYYLDASATIHGLILTLANGAWTAINVPAAGLNSSSDVLLKVKCPAVGSCVAAGGYVDSVTNAEHGLIVTLANGVWTSTSAPSAGLNPPRVDFPAAVFVNELLTDVACTGVGSCVAVGEYEATDSTHGQIVTLANGAWTAMTAPTSGLNPPSTFETLARVACPAVGSCVAVGRAGLGYIATLANGVWTAIYAPTSGLNPAAGSAEIADVACPAVGSCVAVGSYREPNFGDRHSYLLTLANGVWTASNVATSGLAQSAYLDTLLQVSCGAPGSCAARGTYNEIVNNSAQIRPYLLTLANGTWTAAPPPTGLSPVPDGHLFSVLDIVCPAAGSCTAVADYVSADGERGGIFTLANGSWTAMTAPSAGLVPASVGQALTSVGCVTATDCVMLGVYDEASGTIHLFALSSPSVPNGTVISGNRAGSITVPAGATYILQGANVTGSVTVSPGGTLDIQSGSTVAGGLSSNGATSIRICGSTIRGQVNITSTTGPVVLGSPASGCAANTFGSGVTLSGNTGGVEVSSNSVAATLSLFTNSGGANKVGANVIHGSLSCSTNTPLPVNGGQPNTVTGARIGQCASL